MKFAEIFEPLAVDAFFHRSWNTSPIEIRGNSAKFDALPSSTLLPTMCAGRIDEQYRQQTRYVSTNATAVDKDGGIVQLNSVPTSMHSQLYNAGFSLCFGDVSGLDRELRELVEDAATLSRFRSSISVTCYLTPPHSNGVLHFDRQHVFFLQREGTKYWRISQTPAVRNPVENFLYPNATREYFDAMKRKGYEISIPSNCGFRDIKLETGDILYMPPGYYHLQHTLEERSFHYTLTLDTVSFWNLFMSSMHLELLKHCASYNDDIRMLDNARRREFLGKQLAALKNDISSLTVEDLEAAFKPSVT